MKRSSRPAVTGGNGEQMKLMKINVHSDKEYIK